MRKPLGALGLKKFGPGKFWVKKVWAQHIEKVEEKLKEIEEEEKLIKLRKNCESQGEGEKVEEKLRNLRKN